MLSPSTPAPDFKAKDSSGASVTLSSFRDSRNVVLYFFGGAGPACRKQSRSFRNVVDKFDALDADIIAVSANKDAEAFKEKNQLPFTVIADPDAKLQRLYQVSPAFGVMPGRITYVIDKKGTVRSAFKSQFGTSAHIDTAEETLKSLE